MNKNRYLTRIYWSDDDEGFVAEIPALPGCVGVGGTRKKALDELDVAAGLWLADAAKHGDPIPEPDLAREEIERFASILSIAKLARRAGMNQHTLASKLRRGSPFSKSETKALMRALEPA